MSFPYILDTSQSARLGLIVLQVDETIEAEFRTLFTDAGPALYVSRIPSGAELSPETIAQMELDLPGAAKLLPASAPYAAVGYACTSGTTLIGSDRVSSLVQSVCDTPFVTTPLTAGFRALEQLKARKIGLVSPYVDRVAKPVADAFGRAGFEVAHSLSFGEALEAHVARIAGHSICGAARTVSDGVDAVFLSCTNLRTIELIPDLEEALGIPVLSSNLVLGWDMAEAANVPLAPRWRLTL